MQTVWSYFWGWCQGREFVFFQNFQVGGCTWVKPGRFGSFFVLCFLALGGHCLQMLCLPGFGTHANIQNLPHFRAFLASIQEHSPPKCLFFMVNAKLPNRPVFALLQLGGSLGLERGSGIPNNEWDLRDHLHNPKPETPKISKISPKKKKNP